ncbi:salivary cystatin-L2-like [Ixodes scapularis]|uniref:salivary cystatin-L2-like n=1 Tax=Ixodes scapularis TaxID=6945 RepID=UPI001A9DB7F4|nr:salivary cystatin-L2-like [Ixodes scapularis]
MSIVKTALLVVLGVVCVSSDFPGVWRKHQPDMDPRYKEWAHFAISSQVEDRTNFDTLMNLMSVESQVIVGVDYKLKMKVAESDCVIGVDSYSRERCYLKVDVVSMRPFLSEIFFFLISP